MKTIDWIAYFAADNEQGPERGLVQDAANKEAGIRLVIRTCRFFRDPEPGVKKVFLDPNIPKTTAKLIRDAYEKQKIVVQTIAPKKPKPKATVKK